MSALAGVALPTLSGLEVVVSPPERITLKGSISTRDPAAALAGFTRAVHASAVADGLREVTVDLSGLGFVNSSGIRLFVDWATWLKSGSTPPYRLRFVTDRAITWQRTSFKVLTTMFGDVMRLQQVGE